jgi:hypothetical protein
MHEAASRALFDEEVGRLGHELLDSRGWILLKREYPMLEIEFSAADGARLRLRLLCNDWNERPPSVVFTDAQGQALSSIERDPSGVFNNSAHPSTGKPFICMKGVREYHTHPSHTGDAWETVRNNYRFTLGGILTQIWRVWRKIHK